MRSEDVEKLAASVDDNSAPMQFQANIPNLPLARPVVAETTALGAAYAAGLAVSYWSGLD